MDEWVTPIFGFDVFGKFGCADEAHGFLRLRSRDRGRRCGRRT